MPEKVWLTGDHRDPGDRMDQTAEAQKAMVTGLQLAIRTIRDKLSVTELPMIWVDTLLCVAANPGQSVLSVESKTGLSPSSVHRALSVLCNADRGGKPGQSIIEAIVDPRHGGRRIYFLSEAGCDLMAEVLSALTGVHNPSFIMPTKTEFLARYQAEQAARPGNIDFKAFKPQTVMVGKRALKRLGVTLSKHTAAFPLVPALKVVEEIEEWVREQGGTLHRLPTIAKPDGMVIVDFPNREGQVFFYLRWRGPVS